MGTLYMNKVSLLGALEDRIQLCRPVSEAWWLLEERRQAWAAGPSSVKPCQSVRAAPPGTFILSTSPVVPSSSPLRPIKGWFSMPAGQPWRLTARDRWEAREAGWGWGGQWASIWVRGGCWAPASNWTENSPALTCRPEAACGFNHTHTHTVGEFTLH